MLVSNIGFQLPIFLVLVSVGSLNAETFNNTFAIYAACGREYELLNVGDEKVLEPRTWCFKVKIMDGFFLRSVIAESPYICTREGNTYHSLDDVKQHDVSFFPGFAMKPTLRMQVEHSCYSEATILSRKTRLDEFPLYDKNSKTENYYIVQMFFNEKKHNFQDRYIVRQL